MLAQALREQRRLRCIYHGEPRPVEPQCYGNGKCDTELRRVHPIRGGAEREPLFDVAKMEDIVVPDEFFARPGPHHKKNDSAMAVIVCQLPDED